MFRLCDPAEIARCTPQQKLSDIGLAKLSPDRVYPNCTRSNIALLYEHAAVNKTLRTPAKERTHGDEKLFYLAVVRDITTWLAQTGLVASLMNCSGTPDSHE